MEVLQAYHSCFLTDVKVTDEVIKIEDSYRNPYYIDLRDKEAVASFKAWFHDVFMKAVAQTVTIFSYEIKPIEEGMTGAFIKKFLASSAKKQDSQKDVEEKNTKSSRSLEVPSNLPV